MFRTFIRAVKALNTEAEIKAKMEQAYPTLQTNSTARTLEKICVDHIKTAPNAVIVEMLKVLNTIVPKIARDATIQNVYVQIRKALKERYNEEGNPIIAKSYKLMRFDQEKWRANKAAYNAKVFAKNADKRQISIKKVIDVMDLTQQSNNVLDLAIGLQLACGARISEILSYGQFSESKTDSSVMHNTWVIQKGILKQRGDNQRNEIIKPIIHYTREEFFEMLNKLRRKLGVELGHIEKGDMTHYELSQRYNTQINNRVKSLFGEDLRSHDMRKIYANLSYDMFADKRKVSESSWISDVLGHSINSLDVSKSYSVVSVIDNGHASDRTTIPKNTKSRDGHAYDRLLKTVEALQNNFKPITARVLKSYGYGSATVEQYFKDVLYPAPVEAA